MRATIVVLAILATALVAGCAEKNVSVSATSENADIFRNPEGEKPGAVMRKEDKAAAPGRPPFVNLSTYEWEYAEWLASFGEVVSGLRLPESAATYVELRFLPGDRKPAPTVNVVCVAEAAQCSRLRAQVEALEDFDPLPAGFPFPELVVKLSRLP